MGFVIILIASRNDIQKWQPPCDHAPQDHSILGLKLWGSVAPSKRQANVLKKAEWGTEGKLVPIRWMNRQVTETQLAIQEREVLKSPQSFDSSLLSSKWKSIFNSDSINWCVFNAHPQRSIGFGGPRDIAGILDDIYCQVLVNLQSSCTLLPFPHPLHLPMYWNVTCQMDSDA